MKLEPLADVAVMLDIHPQTLRKWVKSGCPHTIENGNIMLDIDAVEAWQVTTKTTGRIGRKPGQRNRVDASYAKWRARRMQALALAQEYENSELRRQSTESRSLHGLRREAVAFLHGLISQIHIYDSTAETVERLETAAQIARRYLSKCWYALPDQNEALIPLRESTARVERLAEHVNLFLSGWPLRAKELAGLSEPQLVARLTLWRDEILDGLNQGPPPKDNDAGPLPGLDEHPLHKESDDDKNH